MHNELIILHDGGSKNMKKEKRTANFYDMIRERRSVRFYEPSVKNDEEEIKELLEEAILAPSENKSKSLAFYGLYRFYS